MSDFLTGLGQNALTSVVGKAIDFGVGELTANMNLRRQRKLMRESDAYQRQLIKDLPSLNKSAMQSAGMSTSMLDGAFQSAATNAAATSPAASNAVGSGLDSSYATSVLTNKNLKKQNELLDAQVKGAQEDVKTKEMDNELKRAQTDDELAFMARVADDNNAYYFSEDNPTVTAENRNKYMSPKRFAWNRGYSEQNMRASNFEDVLRQNKARFDNEIVTLQFMNKDVKDALVNLPVESYNAVVQNVRKLRLDNDFFQEVKKYREEVEKYGPRMALLGILNSMSDLQGKNLANSLNRALQPLLIKNAQSQSANDSNNILEKFLSGHGDWKDGVRVTLPMFLNIMKNFGPALLNPDGMKAIMGVIK